MRQAAVVRAAARMVSAIEPTPATCAGTTFMTTLRDQRRQAARDVEPDPLDRHHALGDRAAGHDVGDDVVLELGLAGAAAAGRIDSSSAARTAGSRAPAPRVERRRRHRDVGLLDAVEPGGVLAIASTPAIAHVVADRPDHARGRPRRRTRRAAPRCGSRRPRAGPGGRSGESWRPV